jgi:hypothetical protein
MDATTITPTAEKRPRDDAAAEASEEREAKRARPASPPYVYLVLFPDNFDGGVTMSSYVLDTDSLTAESLRAVHAAICAGYKAHYTLDNGDPADPLVAAVRALPRKDRPEPYEFVQDVFDFLRGQLRDEEAPRYALTLSAELRAIAPEQRGAWRAATEPRLSAGFPCACVTVFNIAYEA